LGRDKAIIAEATARFDASRVRGDLSDAVVTITMHAGRGDDVATCVARRRIATTPQDDKRYLFAPADSPHTEVVLETFERKFGEVRTQDAPFLIMSLMQNRLAGPEVWRALTGRWNDAIERFPVSSHVAMVASVHSFVADPAFAAEVHRFHESSPLPVGQQQLAQLLDLMDLQVAQAQRTGPTLHAALRAVAD
jgi:puromycin-sensitive aminopeptidase